MERTIAQGFISGAGVAGVAVLLEIAMLIVGLPVALAVRALLEVIGWLFGVELR
jgi:hypothetical protein